MIKLEGVNILGISACVPQKVIDNLEFALPIFGKDANKMIKAIGIKERRVCDKKETSSLDLCVYAAERLIKELQFNPLEIGAVVFVTTSPEYVLPNNATLVQDRLGLSKSIPAYDINLACSGYPFGLWNAGMIAKTTGKKVLLLDGDKQSHFSSKEDKTTALLFSDAGTATIVEPTELPLTWYFDFYTDGSRHDFLKIPHGGSKRWFDSDSLTSYLDADGKEHKNTELYMNGMEIFNFAIKDVPIKIKQLLEFSNKKVEDLDLVALHQANGYMLKLLTRELGVTEKAHLVIEKFGNTCSSSVPLVITDKFGKASEIKQRILMSGFGAGLSIGTAYIEVENMYCTGVLEGDL